MQTARSSGMTFRLELFVNDIPASVDFYSRVLGFRVGESHDDGYTPLHNGDVNLSLNRRAALPDDHPIQATSRERLGRGVEIVLEVEDVAALCRHVQSQGWPLAHALRHQPWGLTDFRVVDPDGYYLRITSRT